MKEERNYAFIDSQNLHLGILDQGWRLDFSRFRIYLKDKYKVTKAFLFIGYVGGNETRYTELQKAGYIVIFKPTLVQKVDRRTIIKGNVDAELILRAMIEYPRYDRAVIVSGDGDFYCLIEYLLKKNKLKRLLVPNRLKYSALLRKFAQYTDSMNALKQKVGKNKEGH